MSTLEDLLKELSQFLGIEDVTFNEEGFCLLELQDQFLLVIRFDKEQQRLVIAAEMETPTTLSKELLSSILAFNFQRMAVSGAWMALDHDTGTLFLADEFLISIMEADAFRKRLERFFQQYLTCQGLFNEEAIAASLKRDTTTTLVTPDELD